MNEESVLLQKLTLLQKENTSMQSICIENTLDVGKLFPEQNYKYKRINWK